MVGRFFLGPWLSSIGFVIDDIKQMIAGDKAIRKAWLLHAIGLVVVVPIVIFGFGMPLWLYILVPAWFGQSLISIRTFAEHQWSEHPEGRTVIIERSPLSFLFLNNNLHFVHHKKPTVAWYELPRLYRENREAWLKANNGYAYPNYLALLKAYAFKAKEPVVHPVWRRQPESGQAFAPRVRTRNVGGLGTAPVSAELPKEWSAGRLAFPPASRPDEAMTRFIAALPMYDWPEVRPEVDAQWVRLRDHLRRQGIEAPKTLVRRNADMPAV